MKTLKYGLSAALLTFSVLANAESIKTDLIEHQQKQAKEELHATLKANPASEIRPAAITAHKKHSVQSPKAEMIKNQKAATEKAIEDGQIAKLEVESRPAATVKQQ